jgi:4a-hydroxytetrahydrobiopterin dehydratase
VAGSSPSRSALSKSDVQAALADLPGWSFADNRLERTLTFNSFREAVTFLVAMSYEAETLNHHPEIVNVYGTVRFGLTTHDAGNKVTEMDLELARRINRVAWV